MSALKTYLGKYYNLRVILYCADLMLNVSAVTSVVKKAIGTFARDVSFMRFTE